MDDTPQSPDDMEKVYHANAEILFKLSKGYAEPGSGVLIGSNNHRASGLLPAAAVLAQAVNFEGRAVNPTACVTC
jgi:hypothetical protein